jgi:hypothetical protein
VFLHWRDENWIIRENLVPIAYITLLSQVKLPHQSKGCKGEMMTPERETGMFLLAAIMLSNPIPAVEQPSSMALAQVQKQQSN